MTDPTTLALCKFLGLDPASTKRVVLILDAEKLPRMTVTSFVRPAIGAEAGLERVSRTRSFDLVPTEERREVRDEMEAIRLDLSVGDGEDAALIDNALRGLATSMVRIKPFPQVVLSDELEARWSDGTYFVGSRESLGGEMMNRGVPSYIGTVSEKRHDL